jgi:hypothetical protein
MRDDELEISADGRFDSPGYTAKFCVYTGMHGPTNKLLDFAAIQRGQVEKDLEVHGARMLLENLVDELKLEIKYFVTDQHSSIATMVEENYPDICHAYEIWHFSKNIRKRLIKLGKKYEKIQAWENAIINHFWFSAKSCKGDADLLVELFHSLLFHVLNIHSWGRRKVIHTQFSKLKMLNRKTPQLYPQPLQLLTKNQRCLHGPLKHRGDRNTMWFEVNDNDYVSLWKKITDTRLCNAMKKCAPFKHTGNLESFHSSVLKYMPKRKAFTMDTTIILTMLASLEHNLAQDGERVVKERAVYSRAQKGYVLKNIVTVDRFSYKTDMIRKVINNFVINKPGELDIRSYKKIPVPKRFHLLDRPKLEELKAKQISRF